MQIIEGCVSSNATCSGEYLLSESILSRNHLRKALVSRFSCSSEASNWSKPLLPKYPWCPEDSHRICIVEVLPTRTVFLKLFKIDITLGQKPTFYPEITNSLMLEKWDFENVNLVKNETLKNVNFVKNEGLKMWILWTMWFWKCEFCQKLDFENVNFIKN